ncbi:hypothetical protein KSC_000650 [Ktedonobacter sp. SOSP1-52]|nr:hypothetical protein KSC_000650 [Ktedonobacter sp. SOSP1-52]
MAQRIVDSKTDGKTHRCRFALVLAQRAVESYEHEISAAIAPLHPALVTNSFSVLMRCTL